MPTPSTARMHDFEVVSNQEIADGIFSLVISAPKLASALKPGQFVNIAVPGDASSLLRVPLSFYRADAEAGTVELWYAVVGDDTRRLSQMGPGSKSNLLGPGGHGWLVPEGHQEGAARGGRHRRSAPCSASPVCLPSRVWTVRRVPGLWHRFQGRGCR